MTRWRALDLDTRLAIAGLIVLGVGLAITSISLSLVVVGGLLIAYAVLPDQQRGGPEE